MHFEGGSGGVDARWELAYLCAWRLVMGLCNLWCMNILQQK